MAQPTILGEGVQPRVTDPRWRILVKIVGAVYNNSTSPNPANAPTAKDTRWSLLQKWDRLKNGV